MEHVYEWFRQLYLDHGINLTIVYDGFDRRRILSGAWMTIRLSVVCLVLSVVIGIAGAWLQGARLALVRGLVQFYVQFFRNTPLLVQLYFFFFAIGSLLPRVRNEFGSDERDQKLRRIISNLLDGQSPQAAAPWPLRAAGNTQGEFRRMDYSSHSVSIREQPERDVQVE